MDDVKVGRRRVLKGALAAGGLFLPLPYAELWAGAHATAPSRVLVANGEIPLDQFIARHPLEILGKDVYWAFGAQLPFLFKILSIRTALSIQAHPDKESARALHTRDPLHYPDSNHKPEIAIALKPTQFLYGFRPAMEIQKAMEEVPELYALTAEGTGRKEVTATGKEIGRAHV